MRQQQLSDSFHKLEGRLETAVADAGQALKTAEQKGAATYAAASKGMRRRWSAARDDLEQWRRNVTDYSQTAARSTDAFVHDRPWTTAGIAIGVGIVIGWLLTRD